MKSLFDYGARQWKPQEFAVCMAMDAFRLAYGQTPRNFSQQEVFAWIEAMSAALATPPSAGDGSG